jgi:hypothetical protein
LSRFLSVRRFWRDLARRARAPTPQSSAAIPIEINPGGDGSVGQLAAPSSVELVGAMAGSGYGHIP